MTSVTFLSRMRLQLRHIRGEFVFIPGDLCICNHQASLNFHEVQEFFTDMNFQLPDGTAGPTFGELE